MPGSTSARYGRIGTPSLRQLSTIEKMAAILGPASLLPIYSQFFRRATCKIHEHRRRFSRTRTFPCWG